MMRLWIALAVFGVTLAAADREERRKDAKRQAEITLRLIEASSDPKMPNDASGQVPAELKTLLTFSRYHMLDAGYLRGREDEHLRIALAGSLLGVVRFDVEGAAIEYHVRIEGARPEKGDAPRLLETQVTGKSGETLVLGASRMSSRSRALIVIITGKLMP